MSLGSFMTAFTPPADCLPTGSLYNITTGSQFYYLKGQPYTSTCFPDGYNPSQDRYYTPATACPESYTAACSNLVSAGSVVETQVRCCPQIGTESFYCKTTKALSSYDNPWGSTLECATMASTDSTTSLITVSGTPTGTESAGAATSFAGMVLAYAVYIHYQKSDLVVTVTASDGDVVTSTGGGSTAATSLSSSGSGSSGLSSGAAAGIGVGVGVAGLAVIAAVVYLFWSRRRRQQQTGQPSQPDQEQPAPSEVQEQDQTKKPLWNSPASPYAASAYPASTYPGSPASTAATEATPFNPNGYAAMQVPAGALHGAPAELPNQSYVHEMPGETVAPVEMDATSHGHQG